MIPARKGAYSEILESATVSNSPARRLQCQVYGEVSPSVLPATPGTGSAWTCPPMAAPCCTQSHYDTCQQTPCCTQSHYDTCKHPVVHTVIMIHASKHPVVHTVIMIHASKHLVVHTVIMIHASKHPVVHTVIRIPASKHPVARSDLVCICVAGC